MRFYDPVGARWLLTPQEASLESLAALEQQTAEVKRLQTAMQQKDAETERLRLELAALRWQAYERRRTR